MKVAVLGKEPTWDASGWSRRFRKASAAGDGGSLRALRREIWSGAVDAVRTRSYDVESERVDLDADGSYQRLHAGTAFYPETESLTVGSELRGRYAAAS